jgi:hypothetical protein
MYNNWVYAFAFLPKALLMLVIISLIARNLWREFPFFLSYAIFQVLETITFVTLERTVTYTHYFWTFYALEAIGTVPAFLVINEIFTCALRPYSALKKLSRVLFLWAFVVILLVAIATAIYAPGNDPGKILAAIITLKRTISLVEVGLLVFLCLFIRAFAIPWRHYLFGLTIGFALYRVAELVIMAARAHWGPSLNHFWEWGLVGAYNFTVIVWVSYFVLPRSREIALRNIPGSQLQQWNDALREVLSNAGVAR